MTKLTKLLRKLLKKLKNIPWTNPYALEVKEKRGKV